MVKERYILVVTVRGKLFIQNKYAYRTPEFPNGTQHQSRHPREQEHLLLLKSFDAEFSW